MGGGLRVEGNLSLENVSVSGNRAFGDGGAIWSGQGVGETLTITNATITGNTADEEGGGLFLTGGGSANVSNSILLGNTAPIGPDVRISPTGTISSTSNLIGGVPGADVFADADPVTGAGQLGDNGGGIPTVALKRDADNPALDSGDDGLAPSIDARGFARTVDLPAVGNSPGATDLGALELQQSPPVALDDAFLISQDDLLTGNLFDPNPTDHTAAGPDSDPDNDVVQVVAVNGSAADVGAEISVGNGGLLVVNADGTFTFDPNDAYDALQFPTLCACAIFDYEIADPFGGTDVGTVIITVQGKNDSPVAVDDDFTTREGLAVSGSVLDNDTDIDVLHLAGDESKDTLTADLAMNVSNGTLSFDSDGTFVYTPDADFTGLDSFTYTVSDGNGATDMATAVVTVLPAAAINIIEATPALETHIGTSANDHFIFERGDSTPPDQDRIMGFEAGDRIDVSDFGFTGIKDTSFFDLGQLTVKDIGTQVAMWGGVGDDAFQLLVVGAFEDVVDGLSLVPLNNPPNAMVDTVTTSETTSIVVDVLANDTDVDADLLSITSFDQGMNGAVIEAAGGLTYTPDEGFIGIDSFSYTIADGRGGTDTADVIVTVAASSSPNIIEATPALETHIGTSANDHFIFERGDSTPPDQDRIMGFEAGDRIDVSDFGFTGIKDTSFFDLGQLTVKDIGTQVAMWGGVGDDAFQLLVVGAFEDVVDGLVLDSFDTIAV